MKIAFVILLSALSFQAAAESATMTLQMDGIEAYDEKALKGPFEIMAWSWGTSAPSGEPNANERTGVQDFSLTKYIGNESPHIMKLIALRKPIKRMVLTINSSNKIVMILRDARFTSQSMGGSVGQTRLTENVSISFSEMEFQTVSGPEGKEQSSSASVPGN